MQKAIWIGAGIAQLVERNLAKVEVASSSLVSRSNLINDLVMVHRINSDKLSLSFCPPKIAVRAPFVSPAGVTVPRSLR
jgi:hypothetical protein